MNKQWRRWVGAMGALLALLAVGAAWTQQPGSVLPRIAGVAVTPPVLLKGLVTDTRMIPLPQPGVYPPKGETLTDPVTNMKVTRVADKSELVGDYGNARSGLSVLVYSRYTPVNTTGEYVLVHGENSTSAWIYRVADNKMMTVLRFRPSMGSASRALGEINELRWDYTGKHPYRLYFVGRSLPRNQGGGENVGMTFYGVDFDPATGTQGSPFVIRDFSRDFPAFAEAEIMNDVEGDSSNDSRYWAWQVMNTSLSRGYLPYAFFTYDKDKDRILAVAQRSCDDAGKAPLAKTAPATPPPPCVALDTPAAPKPYLTRPNMVEMSPLGTRVVLHFERAYEGNNEKNVGSLADGPKALLPDFTDPVRISVDATHSGWAWGPQGEEMFVSQNNRNDSIEAVDIRSSAAAKCKLISGNSYSCGVRVASVPALDPSYSIGFHFGKFYDSRKRGYIYMNTYAGDYRYWGRNQSMFIAIGDPAPGKPRYVRLGSTYNASYDYRSEGSGALDFAAENIWTTANWGFTDGRGDVFRVQLPADTLNLLWGIAVKQP